MTPEPKAHPQKTTPPHPIAGKAQLRLERVFNATPERLWTHWTDPKKYAKWLSPQKADLVIHEFDARVGGRVRFDMPLDNGQVNKEEGVFEVLDAPRRLVTRTPGTDFRLEATFTPLDGGKRTRLVVVVDGVPPEWHPMATEGWGIGFGKLDRLLSGGEAAAATAGVPVQGISPPAAGHVKGRTVHVERWFKAPPERVFKAWGDAKMLPKFFWPVGLGKVDHLDFRPGGQLRMGHASEPWTATWTFVEIVPNRRIVTRDIWPDGSGLEATGTLEFIPENGGTRLKVTHGPFPTEGPYQPEGASAGFAMCLDRLAEETEVPGPGEGFRIVRYFNAPPPKVWPMWTTKEGLAKWWGPSAREMGYAFQVNRLDVRVGGGYDIQMSNKEHGELHNHGRYVEVVPNRRIAQEWDFDIFLGPGERPYPISVAIDLEECPTMEPGVMGTKMTFTQGPMAKPEHTEGSRQGVMQNFRHLAKALGA